MKIFVWNVNQFDSLFVVIHQSSNNWNECFSGEKGFNIPFFVSIIFQDFHLKPIQKPKETKPSINFDCYLLLFKSIEINVCLIICLSSWPWIFQTWNIWKDKRRSPNLNRKCFRSLFLWETNFTFLIVHCSISSEKPAEMGKSCFFFYPWLTDCFGVKVKSKIILETH